MAHEKTVQKEEKKASTKTLKEKRAEKKAKKESKKNNWNESLAQAGDFFGAQGMVNSYRVEVPNTLGSRKC